MQFLFYMNFLDDDVDVAIFFWFYYWLMPVTFQYISIFIIHSIFENTTLCNSVVSNSQSSALILL